MEVLRICVLDGGPTAVARYAMCDRCHLLEGLLHDAETSMSAIGEEVQVLTRSLKTQGKQLIAAENNLKRAREEDPQSVSVKAILTHWRDTCKPTGSSVHIGLQTKRADIVRAALRSYTKGSPEDRVRICMEAISGLSLRPYAGPRGYAPTPAHGGVWRGEIKYALGDEECIERHRGYWLRAQEADVQRAYRAWKQMDRVAQEHFALWLSAVNQAEAAKDQPSLENASGPNLFVVPDPPQEEKAA
jgi:hypothetical protein